jgi:hypothetical protein
MLERCLGAMRWLFISQKQSFQAKIASFNGKRSLLKLLRVDFNQTILSAMYWLKKILICGGVMRVDFSVLLITS